MGGNNESSKKVSENKPKRTTKTTNKKSISRKKTSMTSQKKEVEKVKTTSFGDTITDEIIIILIIVASIITVISLFSSKMGFVGSLINSLFKGLFGFGAYILPITVIAYCVWLLTSGIKKRKLVKFVGMMLFIVFVGAAFSVFNQENFAKDLGIVGKISQLYKNGGFSNGGLIGGSIGILFASAFGKVGATIILVALIIISAILATGKSFFKGVSSAYSYNKARIRERAERIERERPVFEKSSKKDARIEINNAPNTTGTAKTKKPMPDFLVEKEGYDDKPPYIETTVFKQHTPKKFEKAQKGIYDFKIEMENTGDFSFDMDYSDKKEDNNKTVENSYNNSYNDVKNKDFEEQKTEVAEIEKEVIENIDEINSSKYDETEDNTVYSDFDDDDSAVVEKALAEMEKALYDEEHPKTKNDNKNSEAVRDNYNEKVAKTQETNISKPVQEVKEIPEYVFPPIDLLGEDKNVQTPGSKLEMMNNAKKLEETLKSFGVDAKVIQINRGPTVTRYELSPSQGVKVSKIVNLADDIALNLAAAGIRIEAPIPGKAAVGIEVPNKETQSVYLRTVIESEEFQNFPSKLAFALGEDIAGKAVVTDIAKMPHLLIAGATGSGKSVCINTLITSIIYKAKPEEVKLLLVDPKVVELSVYNGIPHLLIPVVTDPKKAASALNWAVREMLQRYNDFAECNVRDIKGYNAMKKEKGETDLMPQIVIIIDELADLMMAAPGEVEDSICRLAQMARAAGLHLIIATQRPSVDVITGVIKANIPSRLAFAVSSGIDSRTILDTTGAEKLLGKGDMLFCPVGMNKPVRIQGAFVTDKEVENIVAFVKKDGHTGYSNDMIEEITSSTKNLSGGEDMDEHFEAAIDLVVKKEKASVSMLQRHFRIGYNRAANLMEALEDRGIVGPEDGSKPRKVLMSQEEYEEFKEQGGFNP